MEYCESEMLMWPGPFATFRRAVGALCSDGKRRNSARIAYTADTFFSVPGAVKVNGKTVSGYFTIETMQGFTTVTPDDPETIKFIAYTYGKNANLLPPGAYRTRQAKEG